MLRERNPYMRFAEEGVASVATLRLRNLLYKRQLATKQLMLFIIVVIFSVLTAWADLIPEPVPAKSFLLPLFFCLIVGITGLLVILCRLVRFLRKDKHESFSKRISLTWIVRIVLASMVLAWLLAPLMAGLLTDEMRKVNRERKIKNMSRRLRNIEEASYLDEDSDKEATTITNKFFSVASH